MPPLPVPILRLLTRPSHTWKAGDTSYEVLIRPVEPDFAPSCELTLWTWDGLDPADPRPGTGEVIVLSGDVKRLLRPGPGETHTLELGAGVNVYPDEAAFLEHLRTGLSRLTGRDIQTEPTLSLEPFNDHPRGRLLARLEAVTAHLPTGVDAEGHVHLDLSGPALHTAEKAIHGAFADPDDARTEADEPRLPN